MNSTRDIAILKDVAHYGAMSRAQIEARHFGSNDGQARTARKRLKYLNDERLLGRVRLQYSESSATYGYYPTPKGLELLLQVTGDEKYRTVSTSPPSHIHLLHRLAMTDTHVQLDDAVAAHPHVKLLRWINEFDTVNADESVTDPAKKYTLFTELSKLPRLVCKPDAAFLTEVADDAGRVHRRVHYLEQDRDTESAPHYVAMKVKGYAELARRQLHRRHFPDTTMAEFVILMVSPTAGRRDLLAAAMREKDKAGKDKPGAELWRFVAKGDLTPRAFFHEPIYRKADGTAARLLKPRSNPPTNPGPLRPEGG